MDLKLSEILDSLLENPLISGNRIALQFQTELFELDKKMETF